ncbi:hypothetical protein M4I21_08185 [Cellulophaga sp. 20_2_10]|uniref:hypothetical protein n=1 Tax=Cellulophaga sp. 20_2_10 TaxID=2942476 RepID=UPI00201B2BD1|nr:hypothetical protein [Cellulophaga sp. 20_2_10]MCL5245782.1 hypothetical protein [Cellulophaga sp. 20_2_10]
MGYKMYGIPLKKLCDEKRNGPLESFISDLDIDCSKEIDCRYPTVQDLKNSIIAADLDIVLELNINFNEEDGWCCTIEEDNGSYTIISADKIKSKTEPITEILSFYKSNGETITKVLFELEKIIGPILYYSDTGLMTMINKEKTPEQVLKEMA